MSKPVAVGDQAPPFTAPTKDGRTVTLADLVAQGPVVLFFYPSDFTPTCTREACAFRDAYEVFRDAGAEVVGVSGDDPARHQEFANRHALPYVLISDTGDKLRTLYGVPAALLLFPGRTTYVIDRSGVVRLVFTANMDAQGHVAEALKVVKQLAASAPAAKPTSPTTAP